MADVARSLLENGIAQLGLEVSSHQLKSLVTYIDLLERWNNTYNLTAIRDRSDIAVRHILDSLSVVSSVTGSSVISPFMLAHNDGVVTVASQKHHEDMELVEVDYNHYEVVLAEPVVKIIKERVKKFRK